ncbi:hypothetical protein FGO68_gene17354 [Halteria grandinella]|uniref:Major facilitator superfamily (MFS) profile domain-containing protein n=1 Tax=Halteria grandinella TaxID=5974 RepID=A0A8J8NU97_HALGN|nr:hypothetical protein FGO68_gene17354 [Halteria grandinella]
MWSYSLHNWVQWLNLECEQPYMIAAIGSANFLGWMLASIIVTRIGDLYGRKLPFIVSQLLGDAAQLAMLFVPDIRIIIALNFVTGLSLAGRFSIAHLYLQELMPTKYRQIAGAFIQFSDAGTVVIISIYNRYISKQWFPMQFGAVALMWVSLVATLFIPESPKYLYSRGRYEQARRSLNQMRIMNICGRQTMKSENKFDVEISEEKDISIDQEQKRDFCEIKQEEEGRIANLFKNTTYVRNLMAFSLQWITGVFAYYSIYFQLKYFKGDIYTNVIIAGGSEMCSNVITGIFGISCSTLYIFLDQEQGYLVPFILLGAFYGYSSISLINWISTPSLFPVSFSSSAIGICNFLARLATIVAPQVSEMEQPLPMVIISIMASVSALGSFFLVPINESENLKKEAAH